MISAQKPALSAAKCTQFANEPKETAERFFDACETGKGWAECRQFCHADATFDAQTDALAGVDTLEPYTDWMKGLLELLPDGTV